ncbi:NADAR domain-containing protein [Paracoccus indicus]|uniref:NADAR domain-containing protein n=1 Tax=Paracoccus indicus TaxID=2079229 RepID=UPI001B8D7517|nr:NADAR domain-containing protein [Paracoccus indicus]
MSQPSQVRTYVPTESAVFLKTNERFGGLSNMAPGFPLVVNGVRIRTSEALYQSCRFPHMPEVQRMIIGERSPMTAKMRSKPYHRASRPDWDGVRVKIMRWCLRVKLAQNWATFGRLLLSTGDRPIVEKKVRRKDFWGATEQPDGTLVGMNVLGRLLMELREQLKGDEAESLRFIEPLAISDFLLFGQPIEAVQAAPNAEIPGWTPRRPSQTDAIQPQPSDPQPSLFEQPMITDTQPIAATAQNEPGKSTQPLKPYEDRRAAGLPWLSEIPAHWQVRRSKYVLREVDKRSETGEETQLSMSQVHGLVESAKIDTWRLRSESYAGGKLCEPGDLVLNRLKAHLGVFAHASIPGVISPDYTVFRPVDDIEVRYFEHLYKTPSYKAELRKRTKGIVEGFWRLYSDDFYDVRVVVPPKDEQSKILAFIDSYDRRVRRLIRNKRRLIGLLNEQKQAIINRAVTRGLNPNAPMKPTGIDWMPEVPAHWEVKPLKHWLRERAKALSDKTSPEYEFDYLDISCVGTGFLTAKPERMKFEDAPSRARQIVQKGDTILSTVRTYLKAVYFIDEERPDLIASTGFAVLRPVERVEPRLLGYVLQSSTFIERVIRASIGVAYPAISEARLGTLHVAFAPDLVEQKAILDHIAAETAAFDKAIEKAQNEITLIREYRERLIADVVTGKLDVRHIEIAAPVDEPISDDDDALEEDLEGDDAEVMEGADADN